MCGSECLASDTTGQVPGDSQGLKRDYPAATSLSLSLIAVNYQSSAPLEPVSLSHSVYLSPLVLLEPHIASAERSTLNNPRLYRFLLFWDLFPSQSNFRETRGRLLSRITR